MKKAVCLTLTIVLVLVFSSCTEGVTTVSFFRDKNNDLADARMEQLFYAIKKQDKDSIKALFSKKARTETKNIDADVNHLLSFVQGDVISWVQDDSPMVFDSVEGGSTTKQLVTWYKVDTDEQNYLFFLVDYPIDTINSDNAGLYSLRIIRAEDENKLTGTWEDWVIPGIYIKEN